MIHERLQTDIVREDSLRGLANATVALCSVGGGGVQLAEQEASLGAAGVADDEAGKGEAVLDEVLCVLLGGLEEGCEVLVAFLVLVASFAPLGHCFAVEDEDMEEGVEEEDGLVLDRGRVEEHGLAAFVVEAVAVERGLDHDERVADVLVVEDVAVEGRLVGGVVEDLQELRATEMEHELWV